MTSLLQCLESISSSLHAPKKLVPQSDLNCLTGPRMERNRRSALIKLEDYIVLITSMCMALVLVTVQGPNTSTPSFVSQFSI